MILEQMSLTSRYILHETTKPGSLRVLKRPWLILVGYLQYCGKKSAKRVISLAKEKKQKKCASDLNDPEHQNEIFRMAKQVVKKDRI